MTFAVGLRTHRRSLAIAAGGLAVWAALVVGALWFGERMSDRRPDARGLRPGAIVYVTQTGARYHRSGCIYLRFSKVALTKREAEARAYRPCRVCFWTEGAQ